ncbi:trypsin-like peptidase domain-containing protein [Paraburkholderia sp. MMS20-SJTN17]|uniref:Probable periplasmic serine endoprotease DegP-like n=1 Tax=Paraburkholderia translucens TaxID=2886945 RepID=A0ABS8K7A9_9BURK|nr:trypsin-like peptidase domain-containing protein [Paraburkholderia sp. MMS20-SJTN17]MCC8400332.1 trypsin-like peptidase domain-containing protein [Paraburkholderia sp. MMS20-SJTN17]
MTTKNYWRGSAAICVALAIGGAYALSHRNADASVNDAQGPASALRATADIAGSRSSAPDFSGIVSRYGPAVVHIGVKEAASIDENGQRKSGGEALGSGFIISQDGYILTNNHVVDGATSVSVKLTDGREFRARVIGKDKASDVAVVKIDATNLPTVKIGNPDNSKVGEWVVAIGSPYGFDSTVTSGIISAKSRSMSDDSPIPFIQTDVPVNPGNSGGPLFNLNGEVIGINSMIYSRTGGFQGLSFAIPIDAAMHVKDQLVRTGHVSRGRIGVGVQPLSADKAKALGLDSTGGALVGSVDPSGPAQAAGLRQGDVIVGVNGKHINNTAELVGQVAQLSPGSEATISVWRNGGERKLTVTVGGQQASDLASAEPREQQQEQPQQQNRPRLGVAVRPLTEDEQQEAQLPGGVVVQQATGPAAEAGIQAGDIIVAVDGKVVRGVEQLRRMIAQADDSVSVTVVRDGAQASVNVTLG